MKNKKAQKNKTENSVERERVRFQLSQKKQADKLKKQAEKETRLKQKQKYKAEREKLNVENAKRKAEISKRRKAARVAFYGKVRKKIANSRHGFGYKNFGLLPRVEFEIRGDATSIATRFSKAGISVVELTKNGAFVRLKIRKKDLHKAIAILNEMCYTFKVGDTLGIPKLGAFMLARIGLCVGAALAVALVNIAYSYIWRLEITGNDKLSVETIESALFSEGIRSGLKKSSLELGAIASAVEKMDGISDASAEVVGTTLRINVLEATDYSVHQTCGAYVSDYDATVTRIVVRSGTSHVKRGDVVKKGDYLADGHIYSTAGELLYTGACDAEIYGNISVTIDAKVSTAAVEYVRTGKSKGKTTFELFGLKLFKASSPFELYESVSTTAHYDVLLPLYATTVKYYELQRVEVERDIDDVVKDFALKKTEELGLGDGFEYSYTVNKSHAGLYGVHLFLSGEALISRGVNDVPEPIQPPQS